MTRAAVVILYHPGPEVIDNIRSWGCQVAKVYAVDNSEPPETEFAQSLSTIDNLVYLPQGENRGVATALNIGARLAASEGFEWLLTMDQDSRATPGMVETMLGCLAASRDISNVGIISPFHGMHPDFRCDTELPFTDVLTTLTSGSLLRMSTYESVGPFRDDFFIDFVDHEYCLRLKMLGYRVVQASRAQLTHALGAIRQHWLLHRKILVTHHSPLRRYYITRNRVVVWNLYGDFEWSAAFIAHDKNSFLRETRNILLFEADKLIKVKMTLYGYRDGMRGALGRHASRGE